MEIKPDKTYLIGPKNDYDRIELGKIFACIKSLYFRQIIVSHNNL